MDTKSLESMPKNNTVAISTPRNGELNYPEIVRRNAKRKVDNGAQFSSTKGKTSLLNCCIDDARSQLGIGKRDEETGKLIPLPDDVFNHIKQAVNDFWFNDARDMVQRAIDNDAKITTRHGVLMSRVTDKGVIVRSKTDKFTAVYNPVASEHRLCDTFGLTAAKTRLDQMLDKVGLYSRAELDAQRRKIATLEDALSAKA